MSTVKLLLQSGCYCFFLLCGANAALHNPWSAVVCAIFGHICFHAWVVCNGITNGGHQL